MQNRSRIPIQCCICGREKTPQGWQYVVRPDEGRPDEGRTVCSHGICEACFEAEVMKLSVRAQAPLAAIGP